MAIHAMGEDMIRRSRILMKLFWALACTNILLFILWICVLFWFDVGAVAFYALAALLVIGAIGARVLRIALISSLRRDGTA